jgi:hypothetical protein
MFHKHPRKAELMHVARRYGIKYSQIRVMCYKMPLTIAECYREESARTYRGADINVLSNE